MARCFTTKDARHDQSIRPESLNLPDPDCDLAGEEHGDDFLLVGTMTMRDTATFCS